MYHDPSSVWTPSLNTTVNETDQLFFSVKLLSKSENTLCDSANGTFPVHTSHIAAQILAIELRYSTVNGSENVEYLLFQSKDADVMSLSLLTNFFIKFLDRNGPGKSWLSFSC